MVSIEIPARTAGNPSSPIKLFVTLFTPLGTGFGNSNGTEGGSTGIICTVEWKGAWVPLATICHIGLGYVIKVVY